MILQYVSFTLGKEMFAIDVMRIRGVERIVEITSIPQCPDFLEGMIHLREEIIPIVDMRRKFGMPKEEYGKETRIILIEIEKIIVGLIVDRVFEVFQIEDGDIGHLPQIGMSITSKQYMRGVVEINNRLIIVIDIDKIFTEQETSELMGNV
jgi:purine-binding chemotaxis protein CheW